MARILETVVASCGRGGCPWEASGVRGQQLERAVAEHVDDTGHVVLWRAAGVVRPGRPLPIVVELPSRLLN